MFVCIYQRKQFEDNLGEVKTKQQQQKPQLFDFVCHLKYLFGVCWVCWVYCEWGIKRKWPSQIQTWVAFLCLEKARVLLFSLSPILFTLSIHWHLFDYLYLLHVCQLLYFSVMYTVANTSPGPEKYIF